MLVLSRHRDEAVRIVVNGVTITVMVIEIRGDKVRLGFSAPQDAVIHREEVWQAIERDGKKEKE